MNPQPSEENHGYSHRKQLIILLPDRMALASLGMDMSSAVNIFLRQCILRGGLPFAVEIPQYNQITLDAMAEARRISRDPDVKGYTSMADLKAALESDD